MKLHDMIILSYRKCSHSIKNKEPHTYSLRLKAEPANNSKLKHGSNYLYYLSLERETVK